MHVLCERRVYGRAIEMNHPRQSPTSVNSSQNQRAAQRKEIAGGSQLDLSSKEAILAHSRSLHERRRSLAIRLHGLRSKRVRLRVSDFQPTSTLLDSEDDILQLAEMAALPKPAVERVTHDSLCVLYLEVARPSAHELSRKPALKEPIAALNALDEESRGFLTFLLMRAAGQELSWWIEADLSTRFYHVAPVSARQAIPKVPTARRPTPSCTAPLPLPVPLPHPRPAQTSSASSSTPINKCVALPTSPHVQSIADGDSLTSTPARASPHLSSPPVPLAASPPPRPLPRPPLSPPQSASLLSTPISPLSQGNSSTVTHPQSTAMSELKPRASPQLPASQRQSTFLFSSWRHGARSYARLRDSINMAQVERKVSLASAQVEHERDEAVPFTWSTVYHAIPLMMIECAAAELYYVLIIGSPLSPTSTLLATIASIVVLADGLITLCWVALTSWIEPAMVSTDQSLFRLEAVIQTSLRARLASTMSAACRWATAYYQQREANRTANFIGSVRLGVVLTLYVCWPTACLAIVLLLPRLAPSGMHIPLWVIASTAALPFLANSMGHVPLLVATIISACLQRVHLEDACIGLASMAAAAFAAAVARAASLIMPIVICAGIAAALAVLATTAHARTPMHPIGRYLRRSPVKAFAMAINFLIAADAILVDVDWSWGSSGLLFSVDDSGVLMAASAMLAAAATTGLATMDCVRRAIRRREHLLGVRGERNHARRQKRVRSAYTRLNQIVRSEHFQSVSYDVQQQLMNQAVDSHDLPTTVTGLVHAIMLLEVSGGARVIPARPRSGTKIASSSDRETADQASEVVNKAAERLNAAEHGLERAEASERDIEHTQAGLAAAERREAADLQAKQVDVAARAKARFAADQRLAMVRELLAARMAEEATARSAMEEATTSKESKEATRHETAVALEQLRKRMHEAEQAANLTREKAAAHTRAAAAAASAPPAMAEVKCIKEANQIGQQTRTLVQEKEDAARAAETVALTARVASRAADDRKRVVEGVATAARTVATTAAAMEAAARKLHGQAVEATELGTLVNTTMKIHSATVEATRVAVLAEQAAAEAARTAAVAEEAAHASLSTFAARAEATQRASATAQTAVETARRETASRRAAVAATRAAARAAQAAAARAADPEDDDTWNVKEFAARARAAAETADIAEAAEVEADLAAEKEEEARAQEQAASLAASRAATRALATMREGNEWKDATATATVEAAEATVRTARAEAVKLAESAAELRAASEMAREVADEAAEAVQRMDIVVMEAARREQHLSGVRIYLVRHASMVKANQLRVAAESVAQEAAAAAAAAQQEHLSRQSNALVETDATHANPAANLALGAAATAAAAMQAAQLAAPASVAAHRENADKQARSLPASSTVVVAAERACRLAAEVARHKLSAADTAKEVADVAATEANARWEAWEELDKAANAAAAAARQCKVDAVVAKHEETAAAIAAAKEAAMMAGVTAVADDIALDVISDVSSTLAQRLLLGQGPIAGATFAGVVAAVMAEQAADVIAEAAIAVTAEVLLAKMVATEISGVALEVVNEERLHGYQIGDSVYYCGHNEKRYSLLHGAEGQVLAIVEPHVLRPPCGERLMCAFGHHVSGIVCELSTLSKTRPPSLAGGFRAGEEVLYTGRWTLRSDGTLLRGIKGEVVGPARGVKPHDRIDQMVAVRFNESDREWRNCYVSSIGRRLEAELPSKGTPLRDSVNRSGSRNY